MRYRGLLFIAVAAAALFAAALMLRARPAAEERATLKCAAATTPAPAADAARSAPTPPAKPPPAGPAPKPEVRQAAVRRHADGMARILRQAIESGDLSQRGNALKSLRGMGEDGVAAVRGEIERSAEPRVKEALRGALAELK